MSQSQEQMLTVKQVADRMNVDEKTVRKWIQSGQLRALNIGRIRPEYRIRPSDFDEFMQDIQTDKPNN
jgi:excisionase family DNA binding protein